MQTTGVGVEEIKVEERAPALLWSIGRS